MQENPVNDENSAAVVLGYAPLPRRRGWLERNLTIQATAGQTVFDWVFGIILPVICLALDPHLVNVASGLGQYETAGYWIASVEIVVLSAWLSRGRRFGAWAAIVAGILLVGALFAFIVAVPLFPLAALGLLAFGIGALGFTPLFTGFVFLRNGVRAIRRARVSAEPQPTVVRVAIGVAFVAMTAVVIGFIIPKQVNGLIEQITTGSPAAAQVATGRLGWYRWFTDMDQVARTYGQQSDATARARLANAYRALTGENVDSRLSELRMADD